jgi:hypothetical protein
MFHTSTPQKSKKKISLHLLHFLDLAPIQIHHHVYNLVGIYFEKTGYKHKWHKFYFTQQQRTDNNGLAFKCCILHKIIVIYIKNSASCRISGVFAVQNKCSFYSVQERQSQDSPKKILTLVTLCSALIK